jgi:hypothetical protein
LYADNNSGDGAGVALAARGGALSGLTAAGSLSAGTLWFAGWSKVFILWTLVEVRPRLPFHLIRGKPG